MKKVNVAIIGCGTVGGGTYDILVENHDVIAERCGIDVRVKKLLDKYPEKLAGKATAEQIAGSLDEILDDGEISVVVETMGGVEPAKTFIKRCFEAGKSVVSANKELIAKCWGELNAAAEANGVGFYFEASCVGGVPVIRTLTESLQGDNITSIAGIFNGTTNFILTKMTDEGESYASVLAEAQRLGFAEADPTSDVEGFDATYKLSILSSLAFNEYVPYAAVDRKGVTAVTPADVESARANGFVIKLIASAFRTSEGVYASVAPCFVSKRNALSAVGGSFNAFTLHGDMVDDVTLTGRGAGARPTGSAIVSDVAYCALREIPKKLSFKIDDGEKKKVAPPARRYFFSASGATADEIGAALRGLKIDSITASANGERAEVFTDFAKADELSAALESLRASVPNAVLGEIFAVIE